MKLSENFYLSEFIRSNTAIRRGIGNSPTQEVVENLERLAIKCLQPIRDNFGSVLITSGYRSFLLNRAIGGSSTSQHCKGEAADIRMKNMKEVFYWIIDNLDFDQLIWEAGDDKSPSWIHISYKETGNRKQILRMKKGKYSVL